MEHTIRRHRSFIECTIAGTQRTINIIDKTLVKNESAAFLNRLSNDLTTQDRNKFHKFSTIGLFKGLSKRAISKCHQLLGPSSQLWLELLFLEFLGSRTRLRLPGVDLAAAEPGVLLLRCLLCCLESRARIWLGPDTSSWVSPSLSLLLSGGSVTSSGSLPSLNAWKAVSMLRTSCSV